MIDNSNPSTAPHPGESELPLPGLHSSATAAILDLLDSQREMTLAVIGPDGWPRATTVSYLNAGLNLYFITGRDSGKLAAITRDPRVGVAIRRHMGDHGDAVGLSITGRAAEIFDPLEIENINQALWRRYPELHLFCPQQDAVAIVKVRPVTIATIAVVEGRSHTHAFAIGPAHANAAFGRGLESVVDPSAT